MITLSMTPYQIKKEMSIDIKNNIIPYLNRNYDNKIRRAILKSSHLPMIFDPIHYYSKDTKIDWYIFYYAMTKKKAEDAACLAVSLVETDKGLYLMSIRFIFFLLISFHVIARALFKMRRWIGKNLFSNL